jgi:hypothetical protein
MPRPSGLAVWFTTTDHDIPRITRDVCSCTFKRLSGVGTISVIALKTVPCRLDLSTSVGAPGPAKNTTRMDTEKLVKDLLTSQCGRGVDVDVLCCKVRTLGIEHSAATSGAGFLALGLQVPPRWKCACGLNTIRLGFTGKSKCNSH